MTLRRSAGAAFLLAGVLALTAPAAAGESATAFVCGIWPDKILFFDPETDTFTEALRLRHGAVTASAASADGRRIFAVTNRMQSVEVIDLARREVVDELGLSTPERRVWIQRVFPNADGTRVYLYVSVVRLEPDRFVYEDDYSVVHYDLEEDEVLATFELPPEASDGGRPAIYVSPDEKTFYTFGRDVHQIDAESHEIVDTIVLSKPLHPGYGALRGVSLAETGEPGVFLGVYGTEDPVQKKKQSGIARIDLPSRRVETLELGPELELGRVALSPDGKRGYAGLNDMAVVDMTEGKVVRLKEGFERGRTNNSLIVSDDGERLYVSGVGDTMYVYDAETLELVKTVFAGGDFMMPAIRIASPRSPAEN